MAKEELTDQQLAEQYSSRQQKKMEKYVAELSALNKAHGLQVTQVKCHSCQGKGYVLQVVPTQLEK